MPRRIAGRDERKLSDKTIYNATLSLYAFFTWVSAEFEMPIPMSSTVALAAAPAV